MICCIVLALSINFVNEHLMAITRQYGKTFLGTVFTL